MRKFTIQFEGELTIGLNDEVIKQVDDRWKEQFYNLETEAEIAEHISYNLIVNRWKLSQLDGFANLADDNVTILEPIEWFVFTSEEEEKAK